MESQYKLKLQYTIPNPGQIPVTAFDAQLFALANRNGQVHMVKTNVWL